ncbi:MAG TPA: tripartite tricarboxylate transporter substrate binding protein [Burkholderiales bacterium]
MNKLAPWSAALLCCFGALHASAQAYPARAVRMIVPFPPGGPNDILGRVVAQKASESLGQQIIVDNRGGAGGIIGTEAAAKAAPDGYTLLLSGTAALSINPSLHAKLPYDPVKDFAPISLLATAPSILIVHPALPVKTVKEFIALAKRKPGALNYASAGIGTPPHLAGELFKSMAGINITHVPYKGGGPALTDLLAGQVELYFSGISSAIPLIKDGRVKAIAVTSAKRSSIMPEMPTIAESGLPGYEVGNWYAILGPAGLPREIVSRVNTEIVKALKSPDTRRRVLELGADPVGSSPEQLAIHMKAEIAKWAKVIKAAGIKAE